MGTVVVDTTKLNLFSKLIILYFEQREAPARASSRSMLQQSSTIEESGELLNWRMPQIVWSYAVADSL